MNIIPAYRRLRPEDNKLDANLDYLMSSRSAWATEQDPGKTIKPPNSWPSNSSFEVNRQTNTNYMYLGNIIFEINELG